MTSDEFKQAQKTIIENHPNLCIELLKQNDGYQIISDYIKDTVKPNINVFKAFLNYPLTDRNDVGLITKYRALTEVPSTIEKTMSEVQLFESNSPFWATDLTVAQIHDVLEAHEELKSQEHRNFTEYLLTRVRNDDYQPVFGTKHSPTLAGDFRWHWLMQELKQNGISGID